MYVSTQNPYVDILVPQNGSIWRWGLWMHLDQSCWWSPHEGGVSALVKESPQRPLILPSLEDPEEPGMDCTEKGRVKSRTRLGTMQSYWKNAGE